MATKKENHKIAKRRALRLKHGIDVDKNDYAKRDTMRAARRQYGGGLGIDG